jgi:hypothetical protein
MRRSCSGVHQQPPRANILERAVQPAVGAKPPLAAIFLGLCPNEIVVQSRERPFAVRQRQPNRRGRALGTIGASRADLVRSDGAVAPGQLHYDPPLHPDPLVGRYPPDHTPRV